MSERIIGWVTDRALAAGILCVEGTVDGNYVKLASGRWLSMTGKHWHSNREAAIHRAEVMRTEKLASLDKQAEKIRNLNFSTAPTEPTP